MRPLILLTAGFETVRGMDQRQLFQNYADAVYQAGGQPLLALGADRELADRADGLFLTGGVDIEPERYHMERRSWCGPADHRRDQEELQLFSLFADRRKQVLGVCRGLQLINTALGGTLWQDQKEECCEEGHGDGAIHQVSLEEGSLIHRLFGDRVMVNSYHHQSVRTLGQGLRTSARSGKIIEGIEHETLPVWAVQWHPERIYEEMEPLFAWFVRTCGDGRECPQAKEEDRTGSVREQGPGEREGRE